MKITQHKLWLEKEGYRPKTVRSSISNLKSLRAQVETQRKNKLPITSNKYLIAKNMEIDDEIINEYLTKLPEEILTMLNDLEPLFDKIKKYSSSPQKNIE